VKGKETLDGQGKGRTKLRGWAPLRDGGTAAARRARRQAAPKDAFACFAAIAALLLATPAVADDTSAQHDDVELVDMPNARMAPDGELSAGFSYMRNIERYNFSFQVLPWLETSFTYSGLKHFDPAFSIYWDRSFGVKARLFNETEYTPTVSIGIVDLIGTEVYGGEYLVASKQFGNLDATLGVGWGSLGTTGLFRNPLTLISNSFASRQVFAGTSGGFSPSAFFHGPTSGLFGGITWHTPLDGLALTAEYSSDAYTLQASRGNLIPRSQVNYGLAYDLSEQTTIGLSWLYGTTLGGNIALRLDPVHPQYPQKIEPPPPPVEVRSHEQQQQALAALLEVRDPRNALRLKQFDSRNADRNDFVDALWRQGSDYIDIQVRQSTLELTVTGPISSTRCAAIARLMQGINASITRVRLRSGPRSVVCEVPRAFESAFASAAFLNNDNLAKLTMPVAEVQTIDASAVMTKPSRLQSERAIRAAITAQNIIVDALSLGNGELVLYYRNNHYFSESDAIDRITRVLSKEAPPEIEKFRLIVIQGGLLTQEFDIVRGPMERSYQQEDGAIFDHSVSIAPPTMHQPVLAIAAKDIYPRFGWGLYPQFRQALFDPNQPFGVQFLASAWAGLELAPGLSFSGSLEASLYDDFNTERLSNSELPHVRSDFIKYFKQGKTGIGNLEADYRFRLAPTVFAAVRAGYLESMFAGAGSEVLWRPEGARWAVGADVYHVWQRDFDRLLGLQHYHKTTGHISLYYDSPWYDLNFGLRAGQYLAGDRGITFQVTRRFSTGVEIGAFFTKTNVSAQQFGEGSFDKGIIIRIPLGWIAPLETQSQLNMDLRPVQRDGGQVLAGDAILYEETRAASQGELLRQQSGYIGP
jgi:hypothetical protein